MIIYAQRVLTQDELDNFPSYGWPIKCPSCFRRNTLKNVAQIDGAKCVCQNCGKPLFISLFIDILSVETAFNGKQWIYEKYDQGVAFGKGGDFEKAQPLFKEIVEGSSTFDRPAIECLKVCDEVKSGIISREIGIQVFKSVSAGDHGTAADWLSEIEKLIALAPTYARGYQDKGVYYAKNESNQTKAIECFEKALKCDSSSAGAFYNLALHYSHARNTELAIENYEKAIRLDDTFAEAHNNIAFEYQSQGKSEKAIKHWHRAVGLKYPIDMNAIKSAFGVKPKRIGCLPMMMLGLVIVGIGVWLLTLI